MPPARAASSAAMPPNSELAIAGADRAILEQEDELVILAAQHIGALHAFHAEGPIAFEPRFDRRNIGVGDGQMLRRRAMDQRAPRRQVERNGVGVEHDMQSPFAGKVAPHIVGQRAPSDTPRPRTTQADAPKFARTSRMAKTARKPRHAAEHDDAEQRQQPRAERNTEVAPCRCGGDRLRSRLADVALTIFSRFQRAAAEHKGSPAARRGCR